jgi:hypothetical protein
VPAVLRDLVIVLSYSRAVSEPLSRLRHRRRWLALLLPFLVLRGLIPAGFMPVAVQEGFIGLCPDAAAMPPGMVMPEHAHHHDGDSTTGARHAVPCCFAQSAVGAGVPTLVLLTTQFIALATVVAPAFLSLHLPAIQRAQTSRAPPHL